MTRIKCTSSCVPNSSWNVPFLLTVMLILSNAPFPMMMMTMMIGGSALLKTTEATTTDDDDIITVYDARSELYRDVTSGEMAYLSSLSHATTTTTSDDNSQRTTSSTHTPKELFHHVTTTTTPSSSPSTYFPPPPPDNNNTHNTHPTTTTLTNPNYYHLYHPHGLDPSTTTIDRSTYASLQNAAENPNNNAPDAAYIFALVHLYGLYPHPSSLKEATKWFRIAASRGDHHPDAQCALGLMEMETGDVTEAIRWFRRSIETGSKKKEVFAAGYWLLADALYRRGDDDDDSRSVTEEENDWEEEAWMALTTAVEMKVPAALHRMAVMYEYGHRHVSSSSSSSSEGGGNSNNNMPDFVKAKKYYQMASDRGYDESSHHLGLMYAYGRGVRKDFIMAREYFRRGAVNGRHVLSMKYLGLLAMKGYGEEGGVSDYDGALFWFEKCEMSGVGVGSSVRGVGESCAIVKETLRAAMKSAEENEQMIINQFAQGKILT